MLAEPPSIPTNFMKRLKALDRNLGLEWLGDHWCVVDESKIMARHKQDRAGLIVYDDYRIIYDRLYHIPKGRILDGGVIRQMRYHDTHRFGDKKYFKAHLENLLAKDKKSFKTEQQDFDDECVSQLKKLKNFSVVVPGRKDNVTSGNKKERQ